MKLACNRKARPTMISWPSCNAMLGDSASSSSVVGRLSSSQKKERKFARNHREQTCQYEEEHEQTALNALGQQQERKETMNSLLRRRHALVAQPGDERHQPKQRERHIDLVGDVVLKVVRQRKTDAHQRRNENDCASGGVESQKNTRTPKNERTTPANAQNKRCPSIIVQGGKRTDCFTESFVSISGKNL